MTNVAWASGHIIFSNPHQVDKFRLKVKTLPDEPYKGIFSIWQGIFNFIEQPDRAGQIVTFGLSHKHFGEPGEVGKFLDFWEGLINGIQAYELFLNVQQDFFYSKDTFHKWYYKWAWTNHPKTKEGRWVFKGGYVLDNNWTSQFETDFLER